MEEHAKQLQMSDVQVLTEMLRTALETRSGVERILAKQEVLIEGMVEVDKDHEKRIRLLERVVGYGGAAVSTGLFFLKAFNKI